MELDRFSTKSFRMWWLIVCKYDVLHHAQAAPHQTESDTFLAKESYLHFNINGQDAGKVSSVARVRNFKCRLACVRVEQVLVATLCGVQRYNSVQSLATLCARIHGVLECNTGAQRMSKHDILHNVVAKGWPLESRILVCQNITVCWYRLPRRAKDTLL